MDSVRLAGLSSPGSQVLGERAVPRGTCVFITFPDRLLGFPGAPRVSSGELISGCDPPGRCQLSRIPGRRGEQLGACSQFGGGCGSLSSRLPQSLASGSGCRVPASLPLAGGVGVGRVVRSSRLAALWYSLSLLFCEQARLCIRAFHGKVLSLSLFFSLAISCLGCYLMLAASEWRSGHYPESLP